MVSTCSQKLAWIKTIIFKKLHPWLLDNAVQRGKILFEAVI